MVAPASSDKPPTLGARIRRRRLESGLFLKDAAVRARVAASTLKDVESGRIPPPLPETLGRILVAVGFARHELPELRADAARERGVATADENLPPDIQALIHDLRIHGPSLHPRAIQWLKRVLRDEIGPAQGSDPADPPDA